MKLIVEIPEKEQLLKEYHIHMNLVDDLKRGTVSDKGFEILYKVLRNGIPLDDIKTEIREETECHYGDKCLGANCPSNTDCMIMGEHAIWIIDKHIRGKDGE